MQKINPIVRLWMTPKFPVQHIYGNLGNNPIVAFRLFFTRWFFHPIKRRLAKYYLIFLRAFTDIKVIGVTGSAGKTTTKEMLASILKLDGKTVYSKANIDPIYNISSTILQTKFGTKYLILEMGVEYPGEMDFYIWLARPDASVITNIFPTHTQFFGDTGGVFAEKSKLAYGVLENGIVAVNSDNKFLALLKGKLKARTIWFGEKGEVVYKNESVGDDFKTKFDLILNNSSEIKTEIVLSVPGKQFIDNALAASAVSFGLGVSLEKIKNGLENFSLPPHRMKIIKHKSGAVIVDDSYNNNPQAAIETINTFVDLSQNKQKIVVFGDMLELGQLSEKYHKELGVLLGKSKLEKLICVGSNAKITALVAEKTLGSARVVSVENVDQTYSFVREYLKKNMLILIKGSRSIHLDELVEKL